jgi:predicted amidophosphoribosyltransferase
VERVVAALDYRDPARALVLALKLRARRAAAEPLVDELARAVARTGLAGEVVTWVPGRTRDVRKRGFDHAEVIARGLAARLGLPVVSLLARSRPRPDQSGLTAAQRWTNLEDAFRARPCSAPTVLVDDLITTGATAGACARALIAAGAPRVELVAACSTEGPDRT